MAKRSVRLCRTIRFSLLLAILVPPSLVLSQETGQTAKDSSQLTREKEIVELVAVLRDKQVKEQDPRRLSQAMLRLAALRATEASDDLAALLAFRWREHPDFSTGSHEGDGYWAKEALSLIGKPALPALVKTFESNDSGTIIFQKAAETVMSIFRDERAQGPVYLREAAKKASSGLGARRLNTAAAYIEAIIATLPPQVPKPR